MGDGLFGMKCEAESHVKKVKYTSTLLEKAAIIRFHSFDLGREVTVLEWLKELLLTLLIEEESFSGKKPFGNSGWKSDAEAALIKAEILKGELDDDGCIVECEDSNPLFLEIVSNLE
jgi:hypothetical protein